MFLIYHTNEKEDSKLRKRIHTKKDVILSEINDGL
jgi:hypothetical protein